MIPGGEIWLDDSLDYAGDALALNEASGARRNPYVSLHVLV